MSGKSTRQIRKEANFLRTTLQQDRTETAKALIEELEKAPFKYRFRFAMKLIFHRKK